MEPILVDTAIIPAAAAGMIAFLGSLAAGRTENRKMTLAACVAVAGGGIAGYQRTFGWPAVPPSSAHEWLPPLLAAAAIVFTIAGRLLDRLFERPQPRLVPAAPLLAVAAGASVISLWSYSASFAQLFGSLAAAIGGVAVVSLVRHGMRFGWGPAGTAAAGIVLLTLLWRYTEASPWSQGLVLLGTLLALAPVPAPAIFSLRPLYVVYRTFVAMLPVAIAAAIAYARYEPFSF